jgi:hypothetical protein
VFKSSKSKVLVIIGVVAALHAGMGAAANVVFPVVESAPAVLDSSCNGIAASKCTPESPGSASHGADESLRADGLRESLDADWFMLPLILGIGTFAYRSSRKIV